MSLREKILRRLEEESKRGDKEKMAHWFERLNQLVEMEEELEQSNGAVALSIRDLIRQAVQRRKDKGNKFRPGDIANEVANDHKLDRHKVREVVHEVLETDFDVHETGNKWLAFRE